MDNATSNNAEDFNNYPSIYTDQQLLILQTTGIVTAIPSLIGSSLIIYTVLKEREYGKRMYQRIMLGLSSMDWIVSSSMIFFCPWAVPQQVNFVLGARASSFVFCSLQGFLANFLMGTLWYSAFLASFFVLLVAHNLQEAKIQKHFEISMHTIAILSPLVTAIYAVSQQYMNPLESLPGNCWMDFYCDETVCRGKNFRLLAMFCGTVTVAITFIIVLLSMIRIVYEVFSTEKRLREYMAETNDAGEDDLPPIMVLTRETCVKALLYIGAFLLTIFALVGVQLCPLPLTVENRTTFFALALFAKLFSPMQGFFNCFIYFRYKTSTRPLRSNLFGQAQVMMFTEPHREMPKPNLRYSFGSTSA